MGNMFGHLTGQVQLFLCQFDVPSFFQPLIWHTGLSRPNLERIHGHVSALLFEGIEQTIARTEQHDEHEDAPCHGKSGKGRAQLVAPDGSVYLLYEVYHGAFLFHESVNAER